MEILILTKETTFETSCYFPGRRTSLNMGSTLKKKKKKKKKLAPRGASSIFYELTFTEQAGKSENGTIVSPKILIVYPLTLMHPMHLTIFWQ